MADVVIDDNGNVSAGSGKPLDLYNSILAYETAANPLIDPNTPDSDWEDTADAWKAQMLPLVVRIKRGWAREANAHAAILGGSGGSTILDAYANRPASPTTGTRFICTDAAIGDREFIYDGALWRPIIGGIGGIALGYEPPVLSNWTQVRANNKTTTFADEAGALAIYWSHTSGPEDIKLLYKAAPASGASGYRITLHVRPHFPINNAPGSPVNGLGYRVASSGHIELFSWAHTQSSQDHYVWRHRYTANNNGATPTYGFNSQVGGSKGVNLGFWLRTTRFTSGGSAGIRKYESSTNGRRWREIVAMTTTANDFITPDQVLLNAWDSNDSTGGDQGCVFDSYLEEAI